MSLWNGSIETLRFGIGRITSRKEQDIEKKLSRLVSHEVLMDKCLVTADI